MPWLSRKRKNDSSLAGRGRHLLDAAVLEKRLLFSATPIAPPVDLASTGVDVDEPEAIDVTAADTVSDVGSGKQSEDQSQQSRRLELVFVDAGIEDYQQLLDDLRSDRGNADLEIYLLDGARNGIDQVGEILSGLTDVDAVHFVSHGTQGQFQLGNTWLSIDNLDAHAGSIASWNDSLRDGADLLIYGCDLAASDDGRALVRSLGELCNCDVAASDDKTGQQTLGGDWDLEFVVGGIETEIAFGSPLQREWYGLLAGSSIEGKIYEDVNGNGDVVDDGVGVSGVTVDVYLDDGTTVDAPDSGDSFVGTDTTNPTGAYSINNLADGTYWVIVHSLQVTPDAGFNFGFAQGDVWAEQTFGDTGSVSFDGVSYSFSGAAGAHFGGMQAGVSDDATSLTTAQHVTRVVISGSNVTVDYGFSFQSVSHTADADHDLVNNRFSQGSLRQAVVNDNAVVGASTIALPAGTYTNALATDMGVLDDLTLNGADRSTTIIDGGGVSRSFDVNGTLNLSDATIQGGGGYTKGGAIHVSSGGVVDLARVVLTGNTADQGAAIFNGGVLTATDVDISGNTGGGGSPTGGGIHNTEDLTLNRVTIRNNTAEFGGGIYVANSSSNVSLTNVTISGNSVSGVGEGGGIWTRAAVNLVNSTIASNTAVDGGGIFNDDSGPVVTITNTLIGDNTASVNPDVFGGFTSDGSNLIENTTGGTGFDPGDITGVDPNLNPLADNGGYTLTHALQRTSQARDNGTTVGAPAIDQRGKSRYAAYDIGAFELPSLIVTTADDVLDAPDSSTISALLSNKGGDGEISLREAILAANGTVGLDEIHFDIAGAGPHVINIDAILGALPTITEAVVIDGYTQTGASANTLAVGNDAVLKIAIDGFPSGLSVDGLTLASSGSTIRGLNIRGFTKSGIEITANGNTIVGNFIGTNITGTSAISNDDAAINVLSANNQIGGAAPADRNVISGNKLEGILIAGSGNNGNTIQGNYIGTTADGLSNLQNQAEGIYIQNGSSNNQIGGSGAGEGNLISGNKKSGIHLKDATTTGNIIQGNLIGVDRDGNSSLAMSNEASAIVSDGNNNVFGGSDPGEGNTISSLEPLKHGIELGGGTGNLISGNSIFDVSGSGIFLVPASGANTEPTPLTLTNAATTGTTRSIDGTYSEGPGVTLIVDFFSNPTSATEEGKVYLGSDTFVTDGSGTFTSLITATVPVGDYITATHRNSGNNTAAFSNNFQAVGAGPPVITGLAGDTLSYSEGDGAKVIEQGVNAVVTDGDSADFDTGNLTVAILAGGDASEDLLSIRDQGPGVGNISVSGSNVLYDFGGGPIVIGSFTGGTAGADLVVTFNANATAVSADALIENITYQNTDTDNPTTSARTIRFTLNDGDGGTSANYDTTVNVAAQNDVPTISNLAGDTLNFTEGNSATVIEQGGNVTVSDVDSADFAAGSLTVSVVAGGDASEDVLAIRDQGPGVGNISLSGGNVLYDFGGGPVGIGTSSGGSAGADLVVLFNANANATAVDALIENITYQNVDTDNPTTASRTIRYTLNDGDGGSSADHDTTVNVAAVNDAATLGDIAGDGFAYIQGAGALVIDQGGDAVVADVDSADFNSGSLSVSIAAGNDASEDVLAIRNQGTNPSEISVVGSNVFYNFGAGSVLIGTWAGGSGGADLVVTLNSSADATATSALLRNITYENTDTVAATTGTRTIRFTVNDGDGAVSLNHDATVNVVQGAPGGVLSGLALWLRADAGVTIGLGGVSQWENQVTNATLSDLQQVLATQRPDLIASGLNFNPIISFDGIDDHLADLTVLGSDLFGTDSASLILAGSTNGSNGVMLQWIDTLSNRVNLEDNIRFDFGDLNNDQLNAVPPSSGYHIINAQTAPGSPAGLSINIDGRQAASGNASVGAPLDNTQFGQFFLGEYPG
ncbi:DUF4347 domain-containing protein, partial [Stieleria sp.]|uniref:DUF4347 domain-containing protein n=1 Tax=Stieleria sp. TaxID=2795976 RepID=UPI0035661565